MAFIIKPLVTEKMTKITDKQPNRYGSVSYTHLDVYKRQTLYLSA